MKLGDHIRIGIQRKHRVLLLGLFSQLIYLPEKNKNLEYIIHGIFYNLAMLFTDKYFTNTTI